jgi:geranylgeranyl reductase family protein
MRKYEVVITGAGPAGSYLAYKLKNQGINVLLLDKKIFPRYKACAGGLSKKTYDILFSENEDIANIVEKGVKRGLYVRNKKFTCVESEKELIYMTYRSELDHFLVNMAVDNKTVFFDENISIQKIDLENNSITYKKNNKENCVIYDILVGAWGSNIRLNKLVSLYPFERFSLSSSWEGPAGSRFSQYFDEYAMCQIMKGYPGFAGYIFPKSQLITAGLFSSLYPAQSVFKKMWKDFLEFWELDSSIKPQYAVIPIRDFRKSIAKKNILLVGDAGGLADPFTGEGIYYALISSKIASKHILNFFKYKNYDLAYEYNKNINSKLSDVQKWAKVYEFLFHHFPNVSFWFGSETSLGNEIVNSFITGEIKYNEVSKIIKYAFNRILKPVKM